MLRSNPVVQDLFRLGSCHSLMYLWPKHSLQSKLSRLSRLMKNDDMHIKMYLWVNAWINIFFRCPKYHEAIRSAVDVVHNEGSSETVSKHVLLKCGAYHTHASA